MTDHYAVLGIGVDASPAAVRAAFRRRIKEVHPDTAGRVRGEGAADEVTRITAAYDVLSDPRRRAAYDAARAALRTARARPAAAPASRPSGPATPSASAPPSPGPWTAGQAESARTWGSDRATRSAGWVPSRRHGRTVRTAIAMVAATLVVGSLVVAAIVAIGGRGPAADGPRSWAVGNCVVLAPPTRPVPCSQPHDARILAAALSADRCAPPADLYAVVQGRTWCLVLTEPSR